MDSKTCVVCNTEKSIDNFHNKYRECKQCNIQRRMERYYENKDTLSNQRKLYYGKNRDVLLAKSKLNQQNWNYERIIYKQQTEELNKKLEDLPQVIEILKTSNSKMTRKNNKIIINEFFSKPSQRNYPTNETDVYHIDDIWSLDILDLKV